MKISYNWLKQYIDLDLEPEKVGEIITDLGLEMEGVEEFESVKGGLKGLVVGEVMECGKHPNADKLSVTKVDVGADKLLDVVCGAPNVAKGQKVAVATIGTVLYDGDESFTIKKGKIRGEVSEGMICAEDELGLGTSHDGIMVLDAGAKVGTPLSGYFKIETDTVFEIGLTPNRVDGASHIGVARDIAAYFNQFEEKKYCKPCVDGFAVENTNVPIEVRVENKEACPRYSGVIIDNIKIAESPEWLQNRLKAIGMSPINNVVDITNYVLHETGQPLHAFDYAKIAGKKVIVKTLPKGTKFTTLDELERELHEDDLMICNEKEAMCIGGVFGGMDSGVTDGTTCIFLESAHFNPVFVRKTAKRQDLNTDSSFRFERGTDPNGTIYAMKRAALLIKELAGGVVSSDIVDLYPEKIENCTVELKFNYLDTLIGKSIERDRLFKILEGLDIKVLSQDEEKLNLEIPAYRVDVTRAADVVEEILRVYGYNNIEIGDSLKSTLTYMPKPNKTKLRGIVSALMAANGFSEAMANSLTKGDYYEKLETCNPESVVKVMNPISLDMNVMRQTLLFGNLEAVIFNINHQSHDLKLFEFGNSYFKKPGSKDTDPTKNYYEINRLSVCITGQKSNENWNCKSGPTSFYELKSYVSLLLERLSYNEASLDIEETKSGFFDYGLDYSLNGKDLVSFGKVSSKICKQFDIPQDVFFAEFNWDNLVKLSNDVVKYTPIPKFPEVRRDLALLVDKQVPFKQIKDVALKTEKKLLKSVGIFDVYEGDKLDENKKSYAVSFILQDETKTLKDKQIEKTMKKLISNFENQLGAKIR